MNLELYIKARDEVDAHVRAYEKRAECGYIPDEQRRRDEERADLFKIVSDAMARLIPNKTLSKDGDFLCPECKSKLNLIYLAADEEKLNIDYCPVCGQAFTFPGEG